MAQAFNVRKHFWMLGLVGCACLIPGKSIAQGDGGGEKIYRQSLRSIVWILSPRGGGVMSSGTGSLIDATKKLVITNYHVVGENDSVIVVFPAYRNGNKLITERSHYLQLVQKGGGIKGKVEHRDTNHDLAVLRLDAVPVGTVPLRLARDSASPGQRVHSIGNPGRSDALWCYTSGTVRQVYHKKWNVSGEGRKTYAFDAEVVETQSPTNPGDSGGPLLNDHGEIVAITQGTAVGAQLISLFIDITEARTFLASKKSLPKHAPVLVRAEGDGKPKADDAAVLSDDSQKLERNAANKLGLAKTLAEAGKLDIAKTRYQKIINDFPNTKAASEAKLLLDKLNK
jgi:S1-C subfamily serine protease